MIKKISILIGIMIYRINKKNYLQFIVTYYFNGIVKLSKPGVFNPRHACGPRASFVWPRNGISQNTMRSEY